jgi:ribonuclease HI
LKLNKQPNITAQIENPDYTILCDGGTVMTNPGPGYGSYQITNNLTGISQIYRENFEVVMTNNQAEYHALCAGLEKLVEGLQGVGKNPADYSIQIIGDSQLVLFQVLGKYQVGDEKLIPLWHVAQKTCAEFKQVGITWQRRENIVKVLGH